MKYKLFFGMDQQLTSADRHYFDKGSYQCRKLMTTRNGSPVAISKHQDPDFPIWKVEYGFTCIVFESYARAMAFCKKRFKEL